MHKLTRRRFLQGIAVFTSLPILRLLPTHKFFAPDPPKLPLASGVQTTVKRLTASKAGYYLITGRVDFDRPTDATVEIFLGDNVVSSYEDAQMISGIVTAIVFKQDADPVELRVYQNSGAVVEVLHRMTMVKLG